MAASIYWASGGTGRRARLKIVFPKEVRVQVPPCPPYVYMKYVNIAEAVNLLKAGHLVVVPTETVYGLAADGLNDEAVAKIYSAKGRPSANPLILHVDSLDMLRGIVEEINADQKKLIEAFWPGPLTLLFKKKAFVPDVVTAGLDNVCVRMPKQKDTLEIIEKLGRPLAAPSANKSGRPSPTRSADVVLEMPDIAMIDGGDLELGIESTIIDVTDGNCRILRAGSLEKATIEGVLGKKFVEVISNTSLAPGMKYKHYSPAGELILVWPWETFGEKTSVYNGSIYTAVEEAVADSYLNYRTGIICSDSREKLYLGYEILNLGGDAVSQAKNLYSTLFETEKLKWQKIVVDMTGIDLPVLIERLKKAASKV